MVDAGSQTQSRHWPKQAVFATIHVGFLLAGGWFVYSSTWGRMSVGAGLAGVGLCVVGAVASIIGLGIVSPAPSEKANYWRGGNDAE